MKKNPGFYALFTAVLMVLSAASFAAGAETDEYSFSGGCLSDGYFHLECDDDELVCSLSQIKTASPGSNDYECWTDGSNGVYEVLANGSYGTYTLKLSSNLYFGGRDGDNCKMAFEPLYRQVQNIDGNDKVVDGFCHITTGNAGFLDSFTGELKNITFTNAYVKGSTNAGVVASNISTRQLSNIKIDGATVIAQNAGGFAGSASQFYLQNSSIRNVNVSGKIAGGAFGRVTFTSGSYGWDADTDTLSGTNLIEGSSVAGGFIGSARISVGYMQFYLQNLVVDADVLVKSTDAILNDSLIVGGLIGSVYASSSNYNYVNLTRNTVKGSVKAKANDVNGNVYVGGLVGYAERTGTGDTYIDVRGAHDYKTFDANVEADLGNVVGNVAVGGLLGNASCEYSGYDVKMEANEVVFAGNVKVVSENVTGNVAAGGFVGNNNGTIDVDESFFDGNVSYETDQFAASSNLYLGSFWGNANRSSIELEHSYSIGMISYSGVAPTQTSVGYFGGYSDETVSNRRIRNNYHFGQDDFMVGIGNYSENDWKTGATYSGNCSNCLYIEYNARNAIDASEIDHADGLRNQIYSEDEMKSDAFAAVIGGSGQEYNSQGSLFTRSDKVLGGLPSFVTKEHLSIRRITLDVTSFKNSDVWNGCGYTLLTDGSKTVVDLYADDQGHLKQTDVDFMNGLLGEGEFWKGPVAISTSSVFLSDVQYELTQTKPWNVMYHFCTGYYDNGDPVYEIGDPLVPNTYTIRYIFSPVTSFSYGDYSALVPPIFASDGSDLKTLQARYAYLNNKTDGGNSLKIDLGFDTAFVNNDRFFDVIANALDKGAIADYHDTVHIVYQYGDYSTGDFEISFASANNATAATYNAYAYENDGSWGNLVESVDITGNSARVPFTSGFTIDISNAPAGYSKDEYTLWFYDQYTSGEDTLISENNYLINSLDYGLYNNGMFAREYRVWKKASVSTKDTIRLDSIYKGVKRGNGSLDNLQMIVQLIPIDYTVSFDLTPFDSRTVVLGGDWTATKTGMNVETNKNLPRVYVMAQAGTKMLYSNAVWGSEKVLTDQSAYTSNYLTELLLNDVNPTSSKIKLYPVENRLATEAKTLRVVAYDEGGNALAGDTDYHGSVILSQVVGDGVDDLKQTSDLCGISSNDATIYSHCLYLPDAADTLTFKVSFDPEDGYTMDLIKFDFDWTDPTGALGEAPAGYGYDASTGKLLISLPHMANNDMTFRVKYTATGPFYVTYNLNSDPMYNSDLYFPVDAVPSETLKFDATHTSQKLWEPYRADDDVCFEGWSAPKKNTYVFKTLPADSAAFLLSTNPDAPTELTANWLSPCTKNLRDPITIANGSTKSSVKLIQKYGTGEFDHWLTNDIVLPENSGIGYKFFVDKANSVASFGYTLGDAVLELDLNGSRAQLEMKGDSMVVGTSANESNFLVSFETTPVPLNFTFHMNTKDTVFYGNDWVSEVNGVTLGSAGPVWPQQIARLNACFTGWSATGKEHDVGYADLNSSGAAGMLSTSPFDMVEMDDGTGQLVSKPVFRMYAMWDENCQNGYPATYKLSTNVAEVVGSFKVYQVVGTDTIARFVSAGSPIAQLKSDDYEFYIDFVPSPLYHLTSGFDMSATYSSDTDPDVLAENVWSGIPYVFSSLANSPAGATEVTLTASGFGVNPLRFVLDVNADSVFYGMGFYEFESEFVDGDALPGDIYRTEYEHVGWSFENGKTTVTQPANLVYQAQTHEFFNDAMVQEYGMYYKTYGRYPDTLFAVWTAIKDPQVNVVVNKSVDKASFRLYREIDGRKIEFLVSDSLKVPATRGFEFNVETIYDSREWTIDGKFPITLVDAKNDTIGMVENFFMVNESMGMIANLVAVPKPVNTSVRVALNENSKDSVYFGSDWTNEMIYDGTDSVQLLPTIVYNAEKCLAGWTVDSTSSELLTVIDKDLLNDLRARSKTQNVDISALLYAKWTTNPDSCAGEFTQLAVEQENGNIWLAEGDSAKTIERRFTDKGTMFVPHELKGSTFKVQAKADSSFMLDSLVVYRHGEVDTVLFEGDYMPENLENVTLKAFFGKSNKTPVAFVKKGMVRSVGNGNAFQLNFKASDFEVTRGITVRVQIIDTVKMDTVINQVLGDSVAMGFEDRFVFRRNKPGDYRMVLSLEEDGKEPVEYSEVFSVDASIAAVAKDGWQMLSLSAIDFAAIDWDDEDQIFYWWDEHGTGEFWQYKQLTKSDSMVNTRGVWYNSLEGRPLPLRYDVEDKGEDFAWNLDSVSTGWNLVANPHGWTVDLYSYNADKLKGVDEESEITFYRYDAESGDHDTVLSIKPYEAVWAHVGKKTKWEVSADPVFENETGKAAEKSRALAKATTKDRWTLQAVLSDEKGKRDSWNILGAGLNPVMAEEPPESMGDHVNLSIVEGKRALAKSIKPSGGEMEWTVALSASSDRVGYLSFAGIEGVNGYGYRVFVTVDGNTTEMQEGMPLKVYLKSTAKMATVRVAPAARVVAQNSLKGLRMARLGGKLKVSFDAVGLAGTNARVDILDMKGNVKSTVTAKTLEGTNALVLDAPQSGLYMLRVRAGSQQQATKIVVQ